MRSNRLRTVFLIIDSVLGLLGGISLLVASFGIANTMIMSILERTREIGIMKAIGAEDREIKLIFFVEAAVLGVLGGVVGVLLAWGIDAVANRVAYRFVLKPQGAGLSISFDLPRYLSRARFYSRSRFPSSRLSIPPLAPPASIRSRLATRLGFNVQRACRRFNLRQLKTAAAAIAEACREYLSAALRNSDSSTDFQISSAR